MLAETELQGADIMFPEILLSLLEQCWPLLAGLSGRSSFPQPLSRDEEAALISRLKEGEASAAEKLVEHNLRLVAHIAKKYRDAATDPEDLVSIGAIGLMKAVSTFRPEAGRLTTYASRCIENEILMHLRAGKKSRSTMLLSEPVGADKEGNEILLMDILSADDAPVSDVVQQRIDSARAVSLIRMVLETRERQVILLRYGLTGGDPLPQHEVARLLGISRSYVSRIEKKALGKLRNAMEQRGVD